MFDYSVHKVKYNIFINELDCYYRLALEGLEMAPWLRAGKLCQRTHSKVSSGLVHQSQRVRNLLLACVDT